MYKGIYKGLSQDAPLRLLPEDLGAWEMDRIELAVYLWATSKPIQRNYGNPEMFHA